MKFQRGPNAPGTSRYQREKFMEYSEIDVYLQGQSHSSETFMKAAAEPRRDLAEVTDPKKKILASKNCSQNKLRITKIRKLSKKKTKNQLQHEFFSCCHFSIIFVDSQSNFVNIRDCKMRADFIRINFRGFRI